LPQKKKLEEKTNIRTRGRLPRIRHQQVNYLDKKEAYRKKGIKGVKMKTKPTRKAHSERKG